MEAPKSEIKIEVNDRPPIPKVEVPKEVKIGSLDVLIKSFLEFIRSFFCKKVKSVTFVTF